VRRSAVLLVHHLPEADGGILDVEVLLPRGIASSGPPARRMPLAALVRRVTGRESADVDEAGLVDVVFKHVRAVFATLAEAVDAEEWFDMIAELPAEYSGLIPERSA
jgi:hypothetical protein